MNKVKTCGNCIFLATDEGEPFYCVRRDLYTFRKAEDAACDDWWWKDALKWRRDTLKKEGKTE